MGKHAKVGTLIAETGEDGNVSWVWIHPNKKRTPRPVKYPARISAALDNYSVIGASRAEIAAWLNGFGQNA